MENMKNILIGVPLTLLLIYIVSCIICLIIKVIPIIFYMLFVMMFFITSWIIGWFVKQWYTNNIKKNNDTIKIIDEK